MKKYVVTLSLSMLLGAWMWLVGCAAPTTVKPTCIPIDNLCGAGVITSCCTSTKCYYLYNGTKYHCDGLDCISAAQDVVAVACPGTRIDGDIDGDMLQSLLDACEDRN